MQQPRQLLQLLQHQQQRKQNLSLLSTSDVCRIWFTGRKIRFTRQMLRIT